MFFLKELPTREILEKYHDRFPVMNVDAVESGLRLMHRASHLIRELDKYFASQGLSQLRFFIMVVIDRDASETGLTPGELTEKIGVSKPVMTRALQSMEKDGCILLRKHETDKRAKRILLTDKAQEKLAAVLPPYYAILENFMSKEDNYDE